MSLSFRTVMMKPQDNVAIALQQIPAGMQLSVVCEDKTYSIELKQEIEFGHKFAVSPIERGEDIIKYGEVIGAATQNIHVGEHVHIHNLEGKRGRGDKVAREQ